MILKSDIEFSLSHYLSLAAYEQSLAFKYTSAQSIKRHARTAEYWYKCAELERQFLKLPGYKPNQPIWAQDDYVEDAIKRIEAAKGFRP